MLTSKDLVAAVLPALLALIVIIGQRRSGKSRRPVTTPPPANLKCGTESDVNKDRRPGGE